MASKLRESVADRLLKLTEKNNQEMFKTVTETENYLNQTMAQTAGLTMNKLSEYISKHIDKMKSTLRSHHRKRR